MEPDLSASIDPNRSIQSDGLVRGAPASVGVGAAEISAFLDDVEAAGLELHDLMIWRNGVVIAEGWHWPYGPARRRMSHSMTKSVTACAIGLLVDAGKLALDDSVCSFFPKAAVAPGTPLSRMTVEDLLTMRSGHGQEVSGSIWRGIATSWVEEFFRIPIEHEPGTVHIYSSAASYMLSAIVTRVTGETIHDFLTPRLFDPLGMTDVHWDIGTDGFNPGGNGISFTTADALKLGILHAQKGLWKGARILPQWWVEQATRAQGAPDYGYHWVVGDGYYAALGVFVQMVMVFHEANAVLTLNAAMKQSSVLLPHLKRHFPAAFSGADGPADEEALAQRLAHWALTPSFVSTSPSEDTSLAGEWAVAANALGITAFRFAFAPRTIRLELDDRDGTHGIDVGRDDWIESRSSLPGAALHHGYRMKDTPTVAGARWIAPDRLELVLHFVESAFRDTFVFTLDGDRLTIDRSVNINSADRAWPTLTATRCAG